MEQYNKLIAIIHKDEVAIRLLEGLIDVATKYFGRVIQLESRRATVMHLLEEDKLKTLTEDLDRSSHYAHDALISDLHIFNRYIVKEYGEELKEAGLAGGIILNPDDSIAIADWAGELLYEIYSDRNR